MAKPKATIKQSSHSNISSKLQEPKSNEDLGLADIPLIFNETFQVYKERTNLKVKIVDTFLVAVMVIGIFNGVYGVLFSRTLYRPFIASVISCISTFILGGQFLRLLFYFL